MALLQDDFWSAIFHDDTHSPRSSRIASCFLELEKVNQDLESKLRDDFNSILNSMDRFSLSPTPTPTPQPLSLPLNPPTRTISTHNSSFTIAAYSWLLENIANPYPSSTVKASLAQQYNCPLSAVNTWFVNARRRMGWTTLCRDYFDNCRANALDAAHRALVNEDPNRPLPPNIIHAFVGVKATAEGLYSSNFSKSALAGDLDAVVRDMTDQHTILVGERKHRELKEMVESPEALEAELQNNKLVAQHSYPSPDYSCSSSPVPPLDESLTDDSEEEEEILPPILAGRKRRLSYSEPAHPTMSTSSTKRRKHMRPTFSPSIETCVSSSEESLERLPHNHKSCSTLISQSSTNISASRKRCLSDADATGIPKPLTAEPLLHAVSDPLPLSTLESDHIIDEWFNSNFDTLFTIPPPADVIEPDLSTQWDVELFSNYNIPPEEPQKRPIRSLNSSTVDPASTSLDSLALDDFLQSLNSEGFVAPTEIMDPTITVSAAADSFVPRDLSLPSESIDWTALLSWKPSDPSLDFIFGQSLADSLPLPEIDFSMLQLP
ncbi:hypothetical protein OG21DRAFT_1502381 [Imleria badia]|nr:hypothetical protein OG21DRAFT_1502381 [Imleria badia]